ncbi:hypothetical protein [Streptomyces chartreusis]|uniref:hypothetical protein n=1 Tax=Streptomyces chartreusis TaxID=1969 RepID=UPI0035E26A38
MILILTQRQEYGRREYASSSSEHGDTAPSEKRRNYLGIRLPDTDTKIMARESLKEQAAFSTSEKDTWGNPDRVLKEGHEAVQ